MADFYASFAADHVALPRAKSRSDLQHGRLRMFQSTFRNPAAAGAGIADRVIWGTLPVGARLMTHLAQVIYNAGTSSCTINLGDNILPARHMAATSITSLGVTVPSVATHVKVCVTDITTGSPVLTNVLGIGCFTPGDLVVGTGIPLGSYVVDVDAQKRTVTISANATATTSSLATTVTGGAFRTSRASANPGNNFTDAYDDCTLISVVAGAIIAVNQVITVRMPYVMD